MKKLASVTHRRVIALAIVSVLVFVSAYGWTYLQTEDLTIVVEAGPAQPGDDIVVDLGDTNVAPLFYGYEPAPLGRWVWTHTADERVRDGWYWPPRGGVKTSDAPGISGEVTLSVPADATGSEFAVCSIENDCVKISLAELD